MLIDEHLPLPGQVLGLQEATARVGCMRTPCPLLPSCVTLGKQLALSGPHLPPLQKGPWKFCTLPSSSACKAQSRVPGTEQGLSTSDLSQDSWDRPLSTARHAGGPPPHWTAKK